uniref:Transmembrane protein n=1 Tax=Ralstonia solanacearum TaxID=305 RepID=A0A0S4TSW3_RALSL|nr:conserved protein of unknown function [Ralstonia solanacearum]
MDVPAETWPRSTVRTVVPEAFLIVTTTSSAPFGTETPKLAELDDSVSVDDGTSTVRPISDEACEAALCVAMLDIVVFSCEMPLTVLICASCEVSCELSIGLSGSWFFSWATSSCMKVFCRSVPVCEVMPVVLVALLVLVVLVVELTVMVVSR